ncbi:SipW-dependent-type signal peptide-containing protein [Ligaoa zhengdingensis]|uniref:SipW-dependent-type signal peptide-containing protein n=1 Tax=Ligaoa zhengdingensis TaxID=2763658 RepID=UPI0031B9BF36
MTDSKNTKRAFLASALSVVLCTAMFVGSTFAWFTDSAATSVNKIQAGNLKIALETKDDKTGEWKNVGENPLAFVQLDEDAGKDILWEPGCTYKLPELRIANKGNLALKFKLLVNGLSGTADEEAAVADLAEVIDVYTGTTKNDVADANKIGTLRELMEDADGAAYGVILPADEDDPDGEGGISVEATDGYTLLFHMQEAAGNKYQDMNLDGISFTVIATQYTYEKDSFDDQYDAEANYPQTTNVADAASLENALNNISGVPVTIVIDKDIYQYGKSLSVNGDVTIDLTQMEQVNDKGITVSTITVNPNASLTIDGSWVSGGRASHVGLSGNAGKEGLVASENSTVALNNVHVASSGSSSKLIVAKPGAKITVEGGYYSTSGNPSTVVFADGGTVEIIDGYFRGSGNQGPVFNVANGGQIIIPKAIYNSKVSQTTNQKIPATCQLVEDGENYIIKEK